MLRPGAPLVVRLGLCLAVLVAGCRLGPLVDDQPGASANILPASAAVPNVATNHDLTNQITLNDSLDSTTFGPPAVIKRVAAGFTGDGKPAVYWPFGSSDRAPVPIYVFGTGDPTTAAGFTQSTSHPPMVEAVPGDPEYEPFHTVFRVAFTDKYRGEKITTPSALTDAMDLGLVQEPVAAKVFINWPIVRPGTTLEVSTTATVSPTPIYGHGYVVDSYPLGGAAGQQPIRGLLPTRQVSFLRGPGDLDYDRARPIFQAIAPAAPPGTATTYSAASMELDVDVKVDRTSITSDGQLFMRDASGNIMSTVTTTVLAVNPTTQVLDLQLQFKDGEP